MRPDRLAPPVRPCHRTFWAAWIIVTLGGCDGMTGVYTAQDGSRDSIEFAGDKVYVTFGPAPTMMGRYELDGDKVIVTMAGASGPSIVLTRADDSLKGVPLDRTFILRQ